MECCFSVFFCRLFPKEALRSYEAKLTNLAQIPKLEPQIPPISQILRRLLGMTVRIFSWQKLQRHDNRNLLYPCNLYCKGSESCFFSKVGPFQEAGNFFDRRHAR